MPRAFQLHRRYKDIRDFAVPLILQSISTTIQQTLQKEAGDKRLVVMIDDLDRVKIDLVPHLLLALVESLDLSRCAFVLGLDPHVIGRALPQVHAGWGTTVEFLEKAIEFPFWLSHPQREDVLRLMRNEVPKGPFSIDEKALSEVADLVSENPRKLKLFLSGLWRLKGQIERHAEDEIDWILLLLIELMRALSFKTAEILLREKSFWDELLVSSFRASASRESKADAKPDEKWMQMAQDAIQKTGELDDQQRIELIRILTAIRDRGRLKTWDHVNYWARVSEEPHVFTWKEFRQLFEQWRGDASLANLEKLVTSHASKRETPPTTVKRELFRTLVDWRQQTLERAADSRPGTEFQEHLETAEVALSLMRAFVFGLGGFCGGEAFLVFEDYRRMFDHFGKWIHWRADPAYIDAHEREKEILDRATGDGSGFATQILEYLRIWDPLARAEPELEELKKAVIEIAAPVLYKELCERFKRRDGINTLWGQDRHLVEKYFLYKHDAGYYSRDVRGYFEGLAEAANSDAIIHENLFEYLYMFTYGLRKGLQVLAPEDMVPLAKDVELMGTIWKGVVARRLQPRLTRWLEETRAKLAEHFGGEEHLPIPKWAKDLISLKVLESGERESSID